MGDKIYKIFSLGFVLIVIIMIMFTASFGSASTIDECKAKILFDESHNTYWGCSIANGYSSFANLLRTEGYQVERSTSGLGFDELKRYDILVAAAPFTPPKPFSTSEIEAIKKFVSEGGGLFLIGGAWSWVDYTNQKMETYPLNPIAKEFSVAFNDDIIYDPTNYYPIGNTGNPIFHRPYIVDHSITQGVNTVSGCEGYLSSLKFFDENVQVIIKGDEDSYTAYHGNYYKVGENPPLLAITRYGQGNVVFSGGFFANTDSNKDGIIQLYEYDNKKLCLNIMDWLASSITLTSTPNWKYQKAITIKENSRKTLTDYQVLVELKGDDFPIETKSSGADIRFADAEGKELNYWIEYWDYSGNNAKIWIKVPSIPASGETKITMYYGNTTASSQSNGDATFEFFDDFEGTSLNTNKWDRRNPKYITVADGKVKIRGGRPIDDDVVMWSKLSFPSKYIIRVNAKWGDSWPAILYNIQNDGWGYAEWINPNHKGCFFQYRVTNHKYSIIHTSGQKAYTFNQFKIIEAEIVKTDYKFYQEGALKSHHTNSSYQNGGKIGLEHWLDGASEYDWILVRTYASHEPTITIGVEELREVNEDDKGTYASHEPTITIGAEVPSLSMTIESTISEAQSAIASATKIDADTTEAQRLLNQAQTALSSGQYQAAIDYAKQAKTSADLATKSKIEAESTVSEAQTSITSATKIGADTTKAKSLLNQAKTAFSSGEYQVAIDYANQAKISAEVARNRKLIQYCVTISLLLVSISVAGVMIRRIFFKKRKINEYRAIYEKLKEEGYKPDEELDKMLK